MWENTHSAPVAQWIEHWPPEPGARVRVAAGVPETTHPELRSVSVEQFLADLRFEGRTKLEQLPDGVKGRVRDVFVQSEPIDLLSTAIDTQIALRQGSRT